MAPQIPQSSPSPWLYSLYYVLSHPCFFAKLMYKDLYFSLGTDAIPILVQMRLKCAITEPSKKNSFNITTSI